MLVFLEADMEHVFFQKSFKGVTVLNCQNLNLLDYSFHAIKMN